MRAVRYVGAGKRLPFEYRKAIAAGSKAAVVNTSLNGGNVTIRFRIDDKPAQIEAKPLSRDFLDLCALIYAVDELESRARSRDHWSRRFDVIAPVKNPKVWERHGDLFERVLKTLSGDEYNFSWCNGPSLEPLGRHRESLPHGFDSVCLFSGGLDSFLGADYLLARNQRVLLVGHQADGTAASAQKALAAWLRKKYPDSSHLVQCRVARSQKENPEFRLPAKTEESHRPRSLLFLALAILVATATGIDRIYLPENGLIALNPPLQKSRLGTLSTRTAHPKYLTELSDFLYATRIFRGRIENPFLFLSKTDMLRGLPKGLATPLLRSVSCARPSRYKHFGVRHCGYCIPCIYRRIAMMDVGLDRDDDYAFSVFQDTKLNVAKQLDFRALVHFAECVVDATPIERESIVLSHGNFSLDVGERFGPSSSTSYAVWAGMLERWSSDFLSKVDLVAASKVKRSLGRATTKKKGLSV